MTETIVVPKSRQLSKASSFEYDKKRTGTDWAPFGHRLIFGVFDGFRAGIICTALFWVVQEGINLEKTDSSRTGIKQVLL